MGTTAAPITAVAPACCALVLGLAGGCREQPHRKSYADPLTLAAAQLVSASASAAAAAGTGPPSAKPAPETEEPPEQAASAAGPSESGPWKVSELFDVGPAGPATATDSGIVMITKQGELARAEPVAHKGPAAPDRVRFGQVAQEPEAFFSFASGPAVLRDYAYFIAGGRLVRRRLSGEGEPEVLSSDGRTGARVAVVKAAPNDDDALPAAVAYIAQQNDELFAKLWVEGAGTYRLSPEGTAANSVALARCENGLLAVSLEGRTSMSPLHARRIRFSNGKPSLEGDVVVWVAGSAQQLTEVHAVGTPGNHAWAFLPIERDVVQYGLARIHLSIPLQTNSEVSWRNYPNGLDPAPADCADICGQPTIAYVRPAEKAPHSPQELHLAMVAEDGLGPSEVVARSRAFANVSIAPAANGAIIAYVADHRTWALGASCPAATAPKTNRSKR